MSDEQDKARMIAILKSHGIEMAVGGCGCCGSPWVTMVYKGEAIYDADAAGFDTSNEGGSDAN